MSNNPTLSTTAQAATLPNILPLHRLTVIGVTLSATPLALLRLRDGTIAQVRPGDHVNGTTVMAIDDTGVILNKRGMAQRMALAA